ncbi:MAG: PEP-CTERM sorting domain-containing protein [Candidatus Sulfopaludibacter sp.]|nr:PEP-CTERM sorting domain-containing protein [Candidatus Sulfopaludibacter sp.]
MPRFFRFFALAAIISLTAGFRLKANTVFNVDLSSYYTPWSSWNPPVAAGSESGTGSTGSGLSFSDPGGENVTVGFVTPFSNYWPGSVTLSTGDANPLSSDVKVNTLINLFNGSTGNQVTVVFTNSVSATDTFTLSIGQTVRDYHDNNNGLDGLTGAGSGVTAVNWWNNQVSETDGTPQFRLDAQTFLLPSSWAGTTLTSMELIYPTASGNQATLSAFQIDDLGGANSPTPEPSSLLLAGAGLLSAGLLRRRYLQ